MSNTVKIILAITGFVVCAFLGYAGTRLITRHTITPSAPVVSNAGSSAISSRAERGGRSAEIEQPVQPSASPSEPSTPMEAVRGVPSNPQSSSPSIDLPTQLPESGNSLSSALEIIEVSKPVYNENDKTYTFTVSSRGSASVFGLADSNKKDLRTQNSATFRVSGTSSGKYYVYVMDSRGNKSEYYPVEGCRAMVKKVDASELQTVLNSGSSDLAASSDFKNRIASNCRYTFTGRDEDEGEAPIHYNEIINRISMHTWSSVQVQSVSYNESGKLSRVVIQVNY